MARCGGRDTEFPSERFYGRLYGFCRVLLERRDPEYDSDKLKNEHQVLWVLRPHYSAPSSCPYGRMCRPVLPEGPSDDAEEPVPSARKGRSGSRERPFCKSIGIKTLDKTIGKPVTDGINRCRRQRVGMPDRYQQEGADTYLCTVNSNGKVVVDGKGQVVR